MIRKTKIIATIGPAISTRPILKKIIQKGVNVCRINFSHTSHEKAREIISLIKSINQELDVHTAILADLQGPKIRIGALSKPIKIIKGEDFFITTNKLDKKGVFVNYKNFAKDVKPKDIVLLDDGKLRLHVVSTDKKSLVKTKVVFGGILSSNKGVNLPNTRISLPCLTKKDLEDLEFVLSENISWIALSFVREAEDVLKLKRLIKKKNSKAGVISKIEKPEAIEFIDEIISVSDGVMVARGDLGVEVPAFRVPAYQKMIVSKAVKKAKPVIIATQMLESMTENAVATRAEVNDVANAVIDGADAVMLSGETSIGKFPLQTVDTMRSIIRDIEVSDYNFKNDFNYTKGNPGDKPREISDAICAHATELSEQVEAKAIITMTYSGYNAIKTSSYRPSAFVYAFTNNYSILNKLSLVWGVQAYYYDRGATTDQTILETKNILKKNKQIKKGDAVISLASMPANEKGMTNMIKLSIVK
jgi:pyruvate kinase|tara:strand:+ start:2547 stop:3971 length:1425 start_codon:yes stop_codon:yes gene_type:complete